METLSLLSIKMVGLPGDERNYFSALQILKYLKIKSLNLITNNPSKINALKKSNIIVKKMITIKPGVNKFNKKYMETKKIPLTQFRKNILVYYNITEG